VQEAIDEREALRDRSLEAIDQAMCAQKELLYQSAPHGSSTFTIGDPKRRAQIERELSALEAEKRKETTAAWKDVATLQKELRELLREKLEEEQRQRVMQP
jgi:hypothetical protein